MKKIALTICLFCPLPPSFAAAAELQADAPKNCEPCEDWNQPQAPFQVFGNTYYVGTKGLGAILVATDEGLILIDGGLSQSAPLIAENIQAAGFDPLNIQYILNSHAHFDHAGGIAALQRYTGAQVLASAGSVAVLQGGEVDAADPQFDIGVEANRYPAVANVSLVADQQTLTLGNTTLTAHYTPGHSSGGTTWTWQSCEGTSCLNMVYADSLSPVSADGYLFSDPQNKANNVQRIEDSISLIRELPCDILLAPHPSLFQLEEKLAAVGAQPEANPFIDTGACAVYADFFDDWIQRRVTKEQELP